MKRIDDLDIKRVGDAEFTKEPYTSRFEGMVYLTKVARLSIEAYKLEKELPNEFLNVLNSVEKIMSQK